MYNVTKFRGGVRNFPYVKKHWCRLSSNHFLLVIRLLSFARAIKKRMEDEYSSSDGFGSADVPEVDSWVI